MQTIDATAVDRAELDRLNEVVRELPDRSPLAAALSALSASVRAGQDVLVADKSEELTPSQAAGFLQMSRTHLYKVMDAGELPFSRVGRDRRIAMRDLVAFRAAREAARQRLAERFAHADEVRRAALAELADVDVSTLRRFGR